MCVCCFCGCVSVRVGVCVCVINIICISFTYTCVHVHSPYYFLILCPFDVGLHTSRHLYRSCLVTISVYLFSGGSQGGKQECHW